MPFIQSQFYKQIEVSFIKLY